MKDKILKWFATGKVGASSKAMACCLINEITDQSHPCDPSDFNRCLLFLDAVPEARQHLDKIGKISSKWAVLVENWDKIERCFLDEVGVNCCNGSSAPKTYSLIDSILRTVKEKRKNYYEIKF